MFRISLAAWGKLVRFWDSLFAVREHGWPAAFATPQAPRRPATRAKKRSYFAQLETLESRQVPTTVRLAADSYVIDESAGTATVTVELDASSANTITVDYATAPESAVAGREYTATSGTLTFAPGQTTKTVTVSILSDTNPELDDVFTVDISNPTNATLGTATSDIKIIDDDKAESTGGTVDNDYEESIDVEGGVGDASDAGDETCECTCDDDTSDVHDDSGVSDVVDLLKTGDVSIVYDPDTVEPLPIVVFTVDTDPSLSVPDSIVATMTFDGQTISQTFDTSGHAAGDTYLLAIQVTTPIAETGLYDYTIDVSVNYSGAPVAIHGEGEQIVVVQNEHLGPGWRFDFDGRIVPILDGSTEIGAIRVADGSGTHFEVVSGNYVSEHDVGTLVKNGNGTYTYTLNGYQWQYDTAGLLVSIESPGDVDQFEIDRNGAGKITGLVLNDDGDNTHDEPYYDISYTSNKVSGIDHLGGHVTLTYGNGSTGSLTSAALPGGQLYTFTYETDGRLKTANHGAGVVTYTYHSPSKQLAGIQTFGGGTMMMMSLPSGGGHGNGKKSAGSALRSSGGGAMVGTYEPAVIQGLATSPAKNASAYLGSITDPIGNRVTFAFDAHGHATRIAYADGGVETFAYDALGNRTVQIDELGRTATFTYASGTHDVTGVVYADGSRVTMQYHSTFHVPTVRQDELGARHTMTYDATTGKLLAETDPEGRVTTYSYNGDGQLVSRLDPSGARTTYVYSSAHDLLESVISPDGSRVTYGYDSALRRNTVTDPFGRVTTTTYDDAGRVSGTISPGGLRTTTVYAPSGLLLSRSDPAGVVTSYVYDAYGRQIAQINAYGTALASRVTTVYDDAGRVGATVDPLLNVTTYLYDSRDRRTVVIDALGHRTTTEYDAAGRHLVTIDALGNRTTSVYDDRDRRIASINALGQRTTTVYDAAGRVIASVDALNRRTTTVYNAAGQAIATVDPTGARTTTTYNAAGQVESTLDAANQRTTYLYDSVGRQIATVDALGGRSTTVYNSLGQVEETIDPLGRRTTFLYDSYGRRNVVIDPTNARTTTTYTAFDRVEEVHDAVGARVTTLYDSGGRAYVSIDALLARTTTIFDAAGRVEATIDARNYRTTYLYDAAGRVTVTLDALGGRTTTGYDELGRVETTTNALNKTTTYYFDEVGRQTAVQDPLGHRSTTVYDALGRVIATIDAEERISTTVYDAAGQVERTIDALGQTVTYVYDAAGRQTVVVTALGRSTTVYDTLGRVEVSIDADSRRTTYAYDALGRQTLVVNSDSGRTTSSYDAVGRLTTLLDAHGGRTTFQYDDATRQDVVIDRNNNRTTTVYDAVGRIVATADEFNHRTTTIFDLAGRVSAVHDANNGRVTYHYDAMGNRTAVVDPVGNRTTSVYDQLGREIETIDPLGQSATFAYDAIGRLTSSTDRLGRRRDFVYDDADRLTSETWIASDGSTTVDTLAYTYDDVGNRLTASNAAGTHTLAYDALNRVVHSDQPTGVGMTFTYDALGRRTRVDDSFGGVETSTYDALGRLTQRTLAVPVDGGPDATLRENFTYNAENQRVSEARYADLAGSTLIARTTTTYDAFGRIASLETRDASNALLADYDYTYDAHGRLSVLNDNGALTTFSYDSTDQLTGEDRTSDDRTYSYDANGNRTMSGYSHGSDNRLTTDGTWNYTYDDEGSMIEKERISDGLTWFYAYDHRNQLTKLEQSDNGTDIDLRIEYKYDVFGNRISRSIDRDADGALNPEVMLFALDAWNPAKPAPIGTENVDVWADLEIDGTLATRYLRSDRVDELLARIDDLSGDPTKYWYVADHLGSTRKLLDANADVANALTYDGYGNILTETDASVRGRYAWTGREVDVEADLQYNRARVYDPTIGRWVSKDPLGFKVGDSSLYRYVHNRPHALLDASGLAVTISITDKGYGVGTDKNEKLGQVVEDNLWIRHGFKVTVEASTPDELNATHIKQEVWTVWYTDYGSKFGYALKDVDNPRGKVEWNSHKLWNEALKDWKKDGGLSKVTVDWVEVAGIKFAINDLIPRVKANYSNSAIDGKVFEYADFPSLKLDETMKSTLTFKTFKITATPPGDCPMPVVKSFSMRFEATRTDGKVAFTGPTQLWPADAFGAGK